PAHAHGRTSQRRRPIPLRGERAPEAGRADEMEHRMNVDEPKVTITDAALRAVRAVEADGGAEADSVLHLAIDAHFRNELYFGPKEPSDLVITASGITLAMDTGTARRATGLTIDYVDGPGGVG